MRDDAPTTVPRETGPLTDHILETCHEMHREDLASLLPLSRRVEEVHADDPQAPRGLARALTALAREMEEHITKEEMILFPAMRAGGGPGIAHPIAVMRADHDDHAQHRPDPETDAGSGPARPCLRVVAVALWRHGNAA